jgi:signal transduction histidine kinase
MREKLGRWVTSLTAKYVAVFVLLVAVPAVGISLYLLDSSYNDNKRALIRLQQEKARQLARAIEEKLDEKTAAFAALDPSGTPVLVLDELLRHLRATDSNIFHIEYFDSHDHQLADSGFRQVTKPPGAKAFDQVRASGVLFRFQGLGEAAQVGFGSGSTILDIVVASNYGGGVVWAQYSVSDALRERIEGERFGHAGYAYVLDRDLVPIDYPNSQVMRRVNGGQKRIVAELPQVGSAAARSSGSATGRNFGGTKVLSAWATVRSTRWKVFVEQPESAAFAPLRGKIWKTALLIGTFVAAAVALSILLARRFVRPIRRMRVAAARIGAGAYDERIELVPGRKVALRKLEPSLARRHRHEVDAKSVLVEQSLPSRKRHDDLGALADDLNRMAASLEASHSQLERTVEKRTRELQIALEQLAEKTRELEVGSTHKSDFLANMSHELRTPLNAIIGFTQVLQQKLFGEVNDKQEEYLEDIHSSANHLLELINDVLDLSKVEAGQVELEKTSFSLREALERGVVMVRERATKNGVSLTLEPDPNVELVEADERRIRQVLFNLLSNAVKFTPPGGNVTVGTAQRNGEVVVSVTDTGPGIAREDQERIFEEFQQTDLGAEQREGTGLGLALSKKLIELHGGRIWVESEPGRGSTFAFALPRVSVQSGSPALL